MEVSPRLLPIRDIIQYILPTLIFFLLFLPPLVTLPGETLVEQLTSIVALSVLFGYIVTPPIQRIVLQNVYPRFKVWNHRKWWQDVWTRELFYIIDTRDQDHLFLLNTYFLFYTTVATYLFLYSMLNLFLVLQQKDLLCTTLLFWGARYNSIHLAIVSFMTSCISYYWSKLESELLYNQTYPMIAVKYHRLQGRIICKLFGRVLDEQCLQGIKEATVSVINASTNKEVDKVETNEQGYYKSSKKFLYLETDEYIVEVHKPCYESNKIKQTFSYNNIDYLTEIMLKKAEKSTEAEDKNIENQSTPPANP